MPNKKFNLVFDASMNISQVKAAVGEIQKSLSGVSMPQNISTRFTKTFEKLNQEIANFEQQAAKGLTEIGDFKNITKAGQNILKYYQDIQATVRQLGNLSDKELAKLFPADVSAKIEKANKAMQEYSNSVKKAESDIEKQNKAVAKQMAAVGKLKTELDELKKVKPATDDQFKDIRTQIVSAQNALEAYKKEQKSIYEENLSIKQGKEKEFEAKGKSPENLKFSQPWREANKVVEEYNQTVAESTLKIEQLKQAQKSLVSKEELGLKIEEKNTELEGARKKLIEIRAELEKMRGAGNTEAFSKLVQEIGKIEGIDVTKLQTIDDVSKALAGLNTNALEQIRQNMSGVVQNTEQAGPAFRNLAGNIDSAENSFKQFNLRAREVENLKEQIAYFFGLSNSIELFKRAVRSAYETVKELDEVMTQTAVVTDFTVGDMWSQLPEYTQRANELGVAVKGAYESATLYYQQGLDTNEVVAVSSETLKMARIAGMDYAEATNYMTAALRGFNMEINETNAQRINDVYSELAAITASDTQEIATAMTKTASIASNAGMEFETTAAFLSQIIETTREAPETAGTALKTVIARFQELKKDPLEIGEVDGEAVDANKIETALRTIDVALRDTNGQFRDLDDVFLDIAQKWDGLDTNTQRYIATIAAGSRQQSRFIAMMSNYARTIELVGAANDSTGASQRQFEKTLDSLESKLAKLENAWNEFTMGLANNTAIKLGVDTVTLLLNVINDLTGVLPEGIDGIAKLGIALLGMRVGGQVIDNFFLNLKGNIGPAAASVKALRQSFTSLTTALINFNKEQLTFNSLSQKNSFNILTNTAAKILNVAANNKLIKSTKAAALAEGLLGKAAMSTGAKLAVSLGTIGLIIGAITVLGFGVKKLYDIIKSQSPEEKFKQLQNATEEAGEAAKEVSSQYIELKDNLTSLEEKYEIIDNFTIGTQAWRDAVQETNNQVLDLIEKYKELAKYVTVGENGELILDVDSAKVQEVVEGYETKSRNANIAYAASNIALEEFNKQEVLDNLAQEYKVKSEVPVAGTNTTRRTYYTDEELEELVKKYARGEIGFRDDSSRAEAYREAGNKLLENENVINAQYSSLLSNAIQVLPEDTTAEALERARNLSNAELINTLVENEKEKGVFNRLDTLKAYAEAQGYSDKTGFRINSSGIVYQEDGEEKKVPINDEDLKTFAAMQAVSDKAIAAMQLTETGFKNDILDAFFEGGLEGKGFTQADIGKIDDPEVYAKEVFDELPQQLKDFYGDEKVFADAFEKSFNIAADDFKKSQERLDEAGLEKINLAELNENLDYGAVSGLSKNFLDVNERLGNEAAESVYNELSPVFERLDDEQANNFAAALNAIDWSDANDISSLSENLVGFGTELGLTETEVFELEQEFIKLAGAIREVDVATLLTQTKGLRDTADDIRDREIVEGITQEEYDLIAGTNKFDMSQFSWTGQEYILTSGTMGQLADVLEDIAGQLAIEGAATDTTNNAQLRQEALLAKNSAIKISADSSYTKEEQRRAIETIKKNEELASSITAISKAYKGNSREFNNFDNHLVDVAINSKEAAKNFGGLNDVVKDNIEILKDPSSNPQGYLDTINSLSEKATEAFGTEVNTDFIQDNLTDFISIGEGGEKAEEAYKKLGKKIAESFLEGIEDINDGLSFTIDEVVTFIESQYPELKVGGSFDASAIFEQFAKTAEGAAQLQSILNSLGYSSSFDISYDLIQKNSAGKLTGRARGIKQENLQWYLDHGYEISRSNFESLATKIDPSKFTIDSPSGGGSSKGTGSTSEWKNPYDKQYVLLEKINELLRDRETLEQNYQRLVKTGLVNVDNTLEHYNKLYDNLEKEKEYQNQLVKNRKQELKDLYNSDVSMQKYATYNESEGIIELKWDLINSISSSNTKLGEKVENWVSEVERITESIEEASDKELELLNEQINIQEQLQDSYLSFEERIATALETQTQNIIDNQQEEFDALTDAENELADAISKSIDEMRQARENEKTEDEIAEKERRLAYLRQDTTGSNALEIKRLEEEIAEQREEYQDALVDQALTNLQAQNEAAAEQRQRQIELMQSQLEYNIENGVYTKKAAEMIESVTSDDNFNVKDNDILDLLSDAERWGAMSSDGLKKTLHEFYNELSEAAAHKDKDNKFNQTELDVNTDYSSLMFNAWRANGGVLTSQIEHWNDLRNQKIESDEYKGWGGKQETISSSELESWLASKTGVKANSGNLEKNSKTQDNNYIVHTIKSGETLSSIAAKYGTTVSQLMKDNSEIKDKNKIYAGKTLKVLKKYETGGIADFTGPAWLDGSKSKPELILNARDTENFIMLKDILSGVLNNASNIKSKSGDNYFDIDIQVDEISNDYDVDQMAERIKQNIYEDSTYRNVNAINLLR